MPLVQNTEPVLYTHYDKLYEFSDLLKRADQGFRDYVSRLSRGQKDYDLFLEAYLNMMGGIKDGTITFLNGTYHDSLGRYTNSNKKNKNKDYYGLVASYIYDLLNSSKEYKKPEDTTKIKWNGNSGVGTAFTRELYGSDAGNVNDFIDLDALNTETKTRSTKNRLNKVADILEGLSNNFDTLYTEYTDADKLKFQQEVSAVVPKLRDGTIDEGDYLALSRLVGGVNFRDMLVSLELVETPQQPTNIYEQLSKDYPIRDEFYDPISLSTDLRYTSNTILSIFLALNSVSDEDVIKSLQRAISNNNYIFNSEKYLRNSSIPTISTTWAINILLSTLKNRNKLIEYKDKGDTLYYIPGTDSTGRQTSWVWDKDHKKIEEKSWHDIPYWREKIRRQYILPNANEFYTSRYKLKKGGILKALTGVKTPWWSAITAYNKDTYTTEYDTSALIDGDMTDDATSAWESSTAGRNAGMYTPTAGYSKDKVLSIELSLYYKDFGDALFNDDGTFTDVGVAWAKATDKLLPADSPARFYDSNGNLRSSWTASGKNVNGKDAQQFTDLRSYVNHVRNDQILGARHNMFARKGTRYYYLDDNRQKVYVDPEVAKQYALEKDSDPVTENDTTWTEYKLTGPKVAETEPKELRQRDAGTEIDLTSLDELNRKAAKKAMWATAAAGIVPEVIGAGRLFSSIRTNNKVTDQLKKAIKPVLEDTYELYSPVTGAFSEMLLRNRLAADVLKQAARARVSDASTNLAASLSATMKANDLQSAGFLADDKEIKRTKAEALKRQEDNIARRSAVANKNRASIHNANLQKTQLEATRLKKNWESTNNYLSGLESRLRDKVTKYSDLARNFYLQTSLEDINNQYDKATAKAIEEGETWLRNNPGKSITDMPNYNNYSSFLKEMARWKRGRQFKAQGDILGIGYESTGIDDWTKIAQQYGYFKLGGQLRPSTLYLINKIIKNENNT